MSKHARAGSRASRPSRTPGASRPTRRIRAGGARRAGGASRGSRRARSSRPLAFAAALGLLGFGVGWAYLAQDPPANAAALAAADARPPAENRAARAAERDPFQGLPEVSERTRAKIPADARQLILVTGKARGSSESTAALYTRPAAGADWLKSDSWPARNGAKGWSTERTYGDLTSPRACSR